MENTLISFETAKLAKEKGFDILQHSYYFEDGEFKENSLKGTNGYYGEEYEFNLSEFNENWNDKWLTKKNGDRCFGCSKQQAYLETFSAPTQSLLQKWLRERKTDITVITDWKKGKRIYYIGFSFVNDKNEIDIWFSKDKDKNKIEYSKYEDALEVGLQEALKLIK